MTKLAALNTTWKNDDEKLYQTARKIVGAYMQHITYEEYLPTVLNGDLMSRFRLYSYPLGHNNHYKASVNPSIRNVFGVAAFRFGHSQISNHQATADEEGNMTMVRWGLLFCNVEKIFSCNFSTP